MKKIISGKVYDTDKARELGRDGGGEGFSSWREALYQKRTGEFFLHGEGGLMTKYAHSVSDNTWTGSEKIIPLSAGKAREWAEEHLGVDEYEAIFGLPDEDAEPVALNIMLDAALMAQLRAMASENGTSLTATVEQLLRAGLN